jgi:large subunit ribosomal protein L3
MRTGLIAVKKGMSRYFTPEGRHIPVTILQIENLQVTEVRTIERDGYVAVQLGAGTPKIKNVNKPQREAFAKLKVAPKKKLMEFRVDPANVLAVGSELSVEHFIPGQFVDCQAYTLGKGFQGAMKRWNFAGHRASHGNSVTHRSLGSTGQRQDPGRVFKGKKMPGHLGNELVTTQNLKVVAVDTELDLILIEGSVPGTKGAWIAVTDAIKKALPKEVPFPAGLKKSANAEQEQATVVDAPAADSTVEEAKSE